MNVIFAFIGANRFHFISTCEIAKCSTYCKLLMRRKMLTSQFENLRNAGWWKVWRFLDSIMWHLKLFIYGWKKKQSNAKLVRKILWSLLISVISTSIPAVKSKHLKIKLIRLLFNLSKYRFLYNIFRFGFIYLFFIQKKWEMTNEEWKRKNSKVWTKL